VKVRSSTERARTADSTPLSTPITIHRIAAPMTSDSVIGSADAMIEFTDWLW
jgi:hypothetical protein